LAPDMTERERRDRLAADLEMLGRIGDPTRGPLARYYLPARPQIAVTGRPVAPLEPWRRSLAVVLAKVHRIRVQQSEIAWSLLNERRRAKRLT
jgi:hypothetical protein